VKLTERHLYVGLRAISLALGLGIVSAGSTYAVGPGPEVCVNCHEDQVGYYKNSVHGQKGNMRGPASAGECSTCHGDATEHVKANGGRGVGGIRNPGSKTMAADEKNAICLGCHAGDSKRTHWEGSTHQIRGNACTSCHTMHTKDRVLTKLTQPEVCFTCHTQKRVEISRMFRHPILEGKVACSDCHNPHGSIGRALMKRDSVVETCYQCHAEKRGPFVHMHEPVTTDCSICHNPHGSNIANLLLQRPPFLCQECHSHTSHPSQASGLPTGRTSSTSALGSVARGCPNCHINIHGGNSMLNNATAGRFRR